MLHQSYPFQPNEYLPKISYKFAVFMFVWSCSKVDENTDYDSVEQWGRDAEEKYFDEEESQNASPEPDMERLSLSAGPESCEKRLEGQGVTKLGESATAAEECMDGDRIDLVGSNNENVEQSAGVASNMDMSEVG